MLKSAASGNRKRSFQKGAEVSAIQEADSDGEEIPTLVSLEDPETEEESDDSITGSEEEVSEEESEDEETDEEENVDGEGSTEGEESTDEEESTNEEGREAVSGEDEGGGTAGFGKETDEGKLLENVGTFEYFDTSDEEDARNTIGNIPVNWYNDYEHIGYDWDGNKILKPEVGDHLDTFLRKMEDPNFWSTVRDPQTGQDVVLSEEDVGIIRRIQRHCVPDASYDEYAPWIEWFSSKVFNMPLRKFPEQKRSFLPSKDEMKRVSKYVHALKMGWMKTKKEIAKERKKKRKEGLQFYQLWKDDTGQEEMRRIHNHIPAPKRALPDHSESYNPPEEYLFNKKEMAKWEKDKRSLGNKKLHFVPQKYNSLREVPSYSRYIRERFMRCLDLYMAPRAVKLKLTIEPEDLLPQLPNPKDLWPFPTTQSLVYRGHKDMVRSFDVDASGQYLASVSDDCTLKLWEVSTGREMKSIDLGEPGKFVSWCPNQAVTLLGVSIGKKVLLINPQIGDKVKVSRTDSLLLTPPTDIGAVPDKVTSAMKWEQAEGAAWQSGFRLVLNHFKEVTKLAWHGKGDYFASVMPEGSNRAVLIHQLSRRKSHTPFSKPRGLVQGVLFHPTRPFFFVATQSSIRIYDLVKQELVKKLISNAQWISSMALHPGGDNLIVGTYDRKTIWFDLDLSTKPYKSLLLHSAAVRAVAFHRRYPLFASVSDDGSLTVCHGTVYNDFMQNPLVVPLKRLNFHTKVNDYAIFDVHFHPSQPWVFTSGADATIILCT